MHPFFLYTETMSIPVLDLEALTSRDQNEIDNLNNALRDHGFFSISNHSIDQNFLEEIYSLSEDFLIFLRPQKINMHSLKMAVLGAIHLLEKKLH